MTKTLISCFFGIFTILFSRLPAEEDKQIHPHKIHVKLYESVNSILLEVFSETYGLEESFAKILVRKLSLFFCENRLLLDHFISESKEIVFTANAEHFLSKDDALIKAAQSHHLLFENNTLRILETIVHPGEIVPFHIHQWDSIVITLQGSHFQIKDLAGNIIEEKWEKTVEKIPGNLAPYCFTNIGSKAFIALSFEIKR